MAETWTRTSRSWGHGWGGRLWWACADSYFSSPTLPVESIRIGAVIGNLGDGWCACFCCQQQLWVPILRTDQGMVGWELMKSSWKGLILYEARHTIHLFLSRGKTVKKCNFYVAATFWPRRVAGKTRSDDNWNPRSKQTSAKPNQNNFIFLQAIFSTIVRTTGQGRWVNIWQENVAIFQKQTSKCVLLPTI